MGLVTVGKDAAGSPAVNKPEHRGTLLSHPARPGCIRKQISVPSRGTTHPPLCQTTGSLSQDITLISFSDTPQFLHIQPLRLPQLGF